FNPDWIPGSLMATEFPGTRLFFEIIFGWVVDWVGIEQTVFWGRLLNFILLAIPVARLFKMFQFSNAQILFLLQLFIIAGQRFFGGEWIFGGLEAKTFSYVFVFWGLLFFLKKEYYKAFGFCIVATYFHILVGGWFAISCFLVLLFQKIKWLELFKLGFFYGIPLLPFLFYLGKNMFAEVPNFAEEINLNYIYTYFRNKHHIGLFYSFDYFFKQHFWGVLISTSVFFIFLKSKIPQVSTNAISTIRYLMLAMLGIGICFVGVSLMDNLIFDLSGGFLLKSYPFRMQSLAFLFFLILSLIAITQHEKYQQKWNSVFPILVFLALIVAGVKFSTNIKKMTNYQKDQAYNEVISFLKQETSPSATIMVLGNRTASEEARQKDTFALDLMRRTARENFVHFKFVPSTPNKMYEWYQRLKAVDRVEEEPQYFATLQKKYSIDYVLTSADFLLNGKVVLQNDRFTVYKVN
ncbi:MAG: hypothetical protein AAF573_11035, partial [Bacteroidota bacterium]